MYRYQIFFMKKKVPRSEIIPCSQYVARYEKGNTGTSSLRTFKALEQLGYLCCSLGIDWYFENNNKLEWVSRTNRIWWEEERLASKCNKGFHIHIVYITITSWLTPIRKTVQRRTKILPWRSGLICGTWTLGLS